MKETHQFRCLIKQKNQLLIVTAILAFGYVALFSPNAGVWGQTSRENRLKEETARQLNGIIKLPGVEFPLVFEDGKYSDELIGTITKDLNLIHSRVSTFEIFERRPTHRFQIAGRVSESDSYLNFGKNRKLYRPVDVHESFGGIVEIEGRKHIVVPIKLIEAYTKAMQFRMEHKVAFIKLEEFISYINSLGPDEEIVVDEAMELYFLDLLSENQKKQTVSEILTRGMKSTVPDGSTINTIRNPLGNTAFLLPSILKVFISDSEDQFKGLFMAHVLIFDKNTNAIHGEFPLVYTDSKWKIALLHGE